LNSSIAWLLAVMFLFFIWFVQPQLELAGLPEIEKVRIFEQKKHDAEVQILFEKQQEQKIDVLLQKNIKEVSQEDMPTWLIYSFWQSTVAKFVIFIVVALFGGLCIVRRI
jgi:hypothetical protein